MHLDAHTINALIAAARQLGEEEVTIPYQDGSITLRFNPRTPVPHKALRVLRSLRKHTLLFTPPTR